MVRMSTTDRRKPRMYGSRCLPYRNVWTLNCGSVRCSKNRKYETPYCVTGTIKLTGL
ncbi:TPA: hypothetical protein KP793_004279 [Clostridioides difficile]|nr:hypothetical protein [Clostridioides difficile]HBG3287216.1 hypothetical protein [Clostridioides difficile]